MRSFYKFIFFFVIFTSVLASQNLSFESHEITVNSQIDGTLLLPKSSERSTLAIIIADSGPRDRNGNQNFQKNNVIKKLAVALTSNDIATFRYDKRIVKQIRRGRIDPNTKFDDFVTDAKDVISYFKLKGDFKQIVIIGHGQGSLIGMLAAKNNADAFVSLAGAGRTIDNIIIEQIKLMDPALVNDTERVFQTLKAGQTTTNYPVALSSMFSPDVQPFLMNWMQYDPAIVIKDLSIPSLIINGSKDLETSIEDAKLLHKAVQNSELQIIDKMNHMLFIIEGDDLENSKSYNESFRELPKELIERTVSFILKN